MNKRTVFIIILIPIVSMILLSAVLCLYVFNETENLDAYFQGETQTALLTQVSDQSPINANLERISNSKKYTLE